MKIGLSDTFNYVLYDNPLSQGVVTVSRALVKPFSGGGPVEVPVPQIKIIKEPLPLWELAMASGPFVRLAGLSGASAVALGAYGAHKKYPKDKIEELKPIYQTANRMHFFHTLALLGVPLCRNPKITGSLLVTGTLLFTVPCYYHAFTGENKFGRLAPIGGTILILGWLSMVI